MCNLSWDRWVLYRPVPLILLRVGTATILRAPIGQEPAEGDLTGITDRHHLGIEQIRRRYRGVTILELSQGPLPRGIEEGLLLEPSFALQRPAVAGILPPTRAGTFACNLPVGFFLPFRLLYSGELGCGEERALPRPLGR